MITADNIRQAVPAKPLTRQEYTHMRMMVQMVFGVLTMLLTLGFCVAWIVLRFPKEAWINYVVALVLIHVTSLVAGMGIERYRQSRNSV
jgi:cytochrome c biogenesis protein CcdA